MIFLNRDAIRSSLFSQGFRPFFPLAAIVAILHIALWGAIYAFGMHLPTYYKMVYWHSHEMIFGTVVAVIAGFFLTAVQNWTSLPMPSGKALLALALLWLVARILAFFPLEGSWLVALIDFSFLPLLAVVVAKRLVKAQNRRNFPFIALLIVLIIANGLIHVEMLSSTTHSARIGTYLAIYVILLMIVVIAGRILPAFIHNTLQQHTQRLAWLEWFSMISLISFMTADLLAPLSKFTALLAFLAAAFHGIRWLRWHKAGIWAHPLLWILYIGYGWLVAGLVIRGFALSGGLLPFLALHAYTVGTMALLILGMMVRISLVHSGKPLRAGKAMTTAFVCLNLSALVRVFLPLIVTKGYSHAILTSSALWMVAFLIFLFKFAPILLKTPTTQK